MLKRQPVCAGASYSLCHAHRAMPVGICLSSHSRPSTGCRHSNFAKLRAAASRSICAHVLFCKMSANKLSPSYTRLREGIICPRIPNT